MKRKNALTGASASLGMLILILDGKTALEGARIGMDLCIKTVIPSLFPFFVLSILLTSSLSGFSFRILKPIQKFCSLGTGTESILISGFLGGYPAGAQSVSAAYQTGRIEKQEAERMLAFCSNAGPSFLFGMVSSMFPGRWMAWSLWLTHIISALLVAKSMPGESKSRTRKNSTTLSVSQALVSALRVMAIVCGWVILFRVLISFLQRWFFWLLPAEGQVILTGLLELSNGCCELCSVADIRLRYLICSGILAFGGVCVTMQTAAVTMGLSLRFYLIGKLLQAIYSIALSSLLCYGSWLAYFILAAFFLVVPWKRQKRGSFQGLIGV